MSEVLVPMDPGDARPRRPNRKRPKPKRRAADEKSHRRAMIGAIIIGSVSVHLVALLLFGAWTVAKRFSRPEARFEMKKVVKIPPKTPQHRMNVARHEALAPKPSLTDRLASARPVDFALPALPRVDLGQMLPLDPSELVADQVGGLVGSAAFGSGAGIGLTGGGGTGRGMDFFGVQARGDRVLLLFDVSASVVNKANAAGIPLERIQEETLKLIDSLPISSQFSLIQFTGNYLPFTEELIAASPGNKQLARQWVLDKWVKGGTMSASSAGVVGNLTGVVGVLERASEMRPDVVFLISDASFQWRPGGGGGYQNVPYDEIRKAVDQLGRSIGGKVPLHFVAFQPKGGDAAEWSKIVKKAGGEFREMGR